jgi:hypothetical protein
MHDLIRRIVRWLGFLLGPGTGTRRVGHRSPAPDVSDSAGLPLHRSPYCLHPPLDGAESRLVRPYLDPDQYVVGAGKAAA